MRALKKSFFEKEEVYMGENSFKNKMFLGKT
jgi:hypothetical protein